MRRIDVILPEKWSDLKPGELEAVSRLFLRYRDKKELLVRCFLLFSGWRLIPGRDTTNGEENQYLFRQKKGGVFAADGDVLTGLVRSLEWITEAFWLPSYVPPIEGFKTPDRMLYGITLEQYLAADNYYTGFLTSGEFSRLDRMLASLYCRDFREANLEEASQRMARRRRHIRFAALLWFTGAKMWMRRKYPFIYAPDPAQNLYPDETILHILSCLNGGDITRNGKVLQTPVHEALHELNEIAQQLKQKRHV